MHIKCIKNYEFPEGEIEFLNGIWYKIDINFKNIADIIYFIIENSEGHETLFARDCGFFDFNIIKFN